MVLPESPRASVTHPIPGLHVYLQASPTLRECSPEVSAVAPSAPAHVPIDLNATSMAGDSSSGGARKRAQDMPADVLPDARNLFDRMPAADNDETANHFMESIIFEGAVAAAGSAGMHDAFMQDQAGLDLDGFLLNHEFPEDYGLEEEDELDIDGEPLFEDELANQAAGAKSERDKLLCECWRDIGQDPKVFHTLEAFKVQHEGKSFNLSHCWRVINGEEKFKAQYAALMARGRKKAVEEVGEGEKPRSRGKTNSKKKDKRDAASIALITTVEGMMTRKDSREEKRRQDKEEQMNAFMEIQRKRLEMEAEKQARMLETEAEKQAKMSEIEAANAKTEPKEVAFASIMTGVEIMKVDLNTVSPRKRPWFEKMQADMLKFDDE
ncbi:hypothetical protein VPH35_118216 [Triticum aestivum]